MSRLVTTLCLFAALAVTARADEAADKALKDLQGEWKVEKMTFGGMELPAEATSKMTLTFKGNEVIPSDHPKDVATIKLDPSKKPAWFDLTPETKKETILGIYELKGDTLTLCLADPKETRPKDFTSTKDSKTGIMVLKRVKK